MLNLIGNYLALGLFIVDRLEDRKNFVSYTAAKTRYKYLQKYDKKIPYDIKYSKATVFVVGVLIWPLLIPIFFKDAKDLNEDFSKANQ